MSDENNTGSNGYEKVTDTTNELVKPLTEINDILPVVTFEGFTSYTILLSELARELGRSIPQNAEAGNAWSYLDGGCGIIIGLGQLFQDSSEPIANKLKGMTTLGGSTQLIWLTAIGLGPIGFTAALSVGFCQSVYDTLKTLRRRNSVLFKHWDKDSKEFWLTDTRHRIEFLENAQKKAIDEYTKLKKTESKGLLINLALYLKGKRILEMKDEIKKLNNDLTEVEKSTDFPQKIQDELNKELNNRLYDNLMLGTAVAGAVMLMIPGLQIIGCVMFAVTCVLFLYKYREEIKTGFHNMFFGEVFAQRAEKQDQEVTILIRSKQSGLNNNQMADKTDSEGDSSEEGEEGIRPS